ncbi:MAG: DUF3987 domain-containing protein [Synechococcus sp. SB0662_bin_45]|nr:DUF3987 domain-containing protein [Synechococcus sp. SB0668_bin_13]MYE22130.1 DUF3987 domain-containing protein [Synechococcus sp. SB0662_bin_45]MYF36813.1 DUF3987 domain-containing protein [Synechococcus sp. SB0678_bin_12]MYI87511.1 DUF3987 domain-containing protein [Synechococcus sp. SB0672_bin_10]
MNHAAGKVPLLACPDELVAVLGNIGRYAGGAAAQDLGQLLSMYDGDGIRIGNTVPTAGNGSPTSTRTA